MSNKSLAKDPSQTTILVTGGAGFIGSHTCVELLEAGYHVVIVDDFSNSSEEVINRIKEIVGPEKAKNLKSYEADILDIKTLINIFELNNIDAIIHFAAFKAVGESTQKPIEYYWNNVAGTIILCEVARHNDVKNIVFSSSATVYGNSTDVPFTESQPLGTATNPYGETKVMVERILTDIYKSDNEWNITLLRYFNPIGAHPSGLIGEDPKGVPNNLLPYVAQVATGKLDHIRVFGDDYDTPDGTGVRDYIHVVDLARGHVKALEWMGGKVGTGKSTDFGSIQGTPAEDGTRRGVGIFNLGTGHGSSVLEVIHAFEKACGKKLPYTIEPRRPGDIATCYASCDKAEKELGWKAEYDLDKMCEDSWNWQSKNPNGYETADESDK